jgi:NAD(P)-dependent dehydrogenase (short-subunit alcohol dehydrogenase family)
MHSEKKVAVITGASQGIGASLVQGFRDIGYTSLPTLVPSEPVTSPMIRRSSSSMATLADRTPPSGSSAVPSSALGASTP